MPQNDPYSYRNKNYMNTRRRSGKYDMKPEDIDHWVPLLMRKFDRNRNGLINARELPPLLNEFMMACQLPPIMNEDVEQLMHAFDRDHSGDFDQEEIDLMLMALGRVGRKGLKRTRRRHIDLTGSDLH